MIDNLLLKRIYLSMVLRIMSKTNWVGSVRRTSQPVKTRLASRCSTSCIMSHACQSWEELISSKPCNVYTNHSLHIWEMGLPVSLDCCGTEQGVFTQGVPGACAERVSECRASCHRSFLWALAPNVVHGYVAAKSLQLWSRAHLLGTERRGIPSVKGDVCFGGIIASWRQQASVSRLRWRDVDRGKCKNGLAPERSCCLEGPWVSPQATYSTQTWSVKVSMVGMFLKWNNLRSGRKYLGLILHVHQHFTAIDDISGNTRLVLVGWFFFFLGSTKVLFCFNFLAFSVSLEDFTRVS